MRTNAHKCAQMRTNANFRILCVWPGVPAQLLLHCPFFSGNSEPSCGYFLYPDGRVCAWSQNWWVRKTVWNVNGALYFDTESGYHNKHTDSVALLTEPPTGGFQYSWDLLLESHPEWEERLMMADEDEQHSEN